MTEGDVMTLSAPWGRDPLSTCPESQNLTDTVTSVGDISRQVIAQSTLRTERISEESQEEVQAICSGMESLGSAVGDERVGLSAVALDIGAGSGSTSVDISAERKLAAAPTLTGEVVCSSEESTDTLELERRIERRNRETCEDLVDDSADTKSEIEECGVAGVVPGTSSGKTGTGDDDGSPNSDTSDKTVVPTGMYHNISGNLSIPSYLFQKE